MKKVLFLVGVTVLLASCSQNSIEETWTSKREISFNNLNRKVTRAANDSGDDYQVLANTSLSTSEWFINDLVYGKDKDACKLDNAANGPYYWLNQAATYDFYAFAPANSVNIAKTVTYPDVNLTYTVPASGQEDFTVATPVHIKTIPAESVVKLVFNHMLAKVNVTAILTPALIKAGYSIEFGSATFGVKRNQGDVDAKQDVPSIAESTGDPATYTSSKSYMFMPQPATGSTIQLKNVVIRKAGVDHFIGDLTTYTIADGNVESNIFSGGKVYNLEFTINEDATTPIGPDGKPKPGTKVFNIIKFVSSVNPWNEVKTPLKQK